MNSLDKKKTNENKPLLQTKLVFSTNGKLKITLDTSTATPKKETNLKQDDKSKARDKAKNKCQNNDKHSVKNNVKGDIKGDIKCDVKPIKTHYQMIICHLKIINKNRHFKCLKV